MLLREPALIEPVGAARPSASRAPFLTAGNPRPVLYAARDSDADAVLALVLEPKARPTPMRVQWPISMRDAKWAG